MPDRIIKERSRRSASLDRVSAEAERLFFRLITYADDYGRFPADPALIIAGCFPRAALRFSPEIVVTWYAELQQEGMVSTWEDEGQFYGRIVNWKKDQREPRARKSKYPAPSGNLLADARELLTNARDSHADARDSRTNAPDLRSTVYDLRDSRSVSRDSNPRLEGEIVSREAAATDPQSPAQPARQVNPGRDTASLRSETQKTEPHPDPSQPPPRGPKGGLRRAGEGIQALGDFLDRKRDLLREPSTPPPREPRKGRARSPGKAGAHSDDDQLASAMWRRVFDASTDAERPTFEPRAEAAVKAIGGWDALAMLQGESEIAKAAYAFRDAYLGTNPSPAATEAQEALA